MPCIFEAMTHVTDKLTDYLESAGTPEELRQIERHLRTCAGCRLALVELRTTIAHLAQLPDVRTPETLKTALLEKFRNHE